MNTCHGPIGLVDSAGRLVAHYAAPGQKVGYAYALDAAGQSVRTITAYTNESAGISRVQVSARDGSLLSVTGAVVRAVRGDYGPTNGGTCTWEISLNSSGADTAEWTLRFADALGREYRVLYPDGAESQSFYNAQGQLARRVDPDGVQTLYQYNAKGEREFTILDVDRDGEVDGFDRVTQSVSVVTNNGAADVNGSVPNGG